MTSSATHFLKTSAGLLKYNMELSLERDENTKNCKNISILSNKHRTDLLKF